MGKRDAELLKGSSGLKRNSRYVENRTIKKGHG